MTDAVEINRRKTRWYVRLAHSAVSWTCGTLRNQDGTPDEFAERNARFLGTVADDQTFVRMVTLTTVHEGRELVLELPPEEAEKRGYELVAGAAQVRQRNIHQRNGHVGSRSPFQEVVDAHKLAQRAAVDRASEMLRLIWPDLKPSRMPLGTTSDQFLTATHPVYGKWHLAIQDDGATVKVEASDVPAEAWGRFVSRAVDRLWFRTRDWPGAEAWATVKKGEYTAQSHRWEYPDVLDVAVGGRAEKLVLWMVDVRKVAPALVSMFCPEEEC